MPTGPLPPSDDYLGDGDRTTGEFQAELNNLQNWARQFQAQLDALSSTTPGEAFNRAVGTGASDLVQTSQLDTRLGTSGDLGSAATKDFGLLDGNLPETMNATVQLGGDYVGGQNGQVFVSKVGKIVVITGVSSILDHTDGISSPSSADGAIPSWARPSSGSVYNIYRNDSLSVYQIEVTSSGQVVCVRRDNSGAPMPRNDTARPTISYSTDN